MAMDLPGDFRLHHVKPTRPGKGRDRVTTYIRVPATVADIADIGESQLDQVRPPDGGEFIFHAAGGLANPLPLEDVLPVPICKVIPAYSRARSLKTKAELKDKFMELYGMFLGDGTLIAKRGVFASNRIVEFGQVKKHDNSWIQQHLDAIGLVQGSDYVVYPPTGGRRSTLFDITNGAWLKLFFGEFACKYTHGLAHAEALGVSGRAQRSYAAARKAAGLDAHAKWPKSGKWLPDWAFKLCRAECEALLRGVFCADGRSPSSKRQMELTAEDKDHGANVVFTSCELFRDQLVRFMWHAGRTCFYTRTLKKGDEREIKSQQRVAVAQHDHWWVNMAFPNVTDSNMTPVVGARFFTRAKCQRQALFYQVMTRSGLPCIARRAPLGRDKSTSNRAFVLWQPAPQAAAASAGKAQARKADVRRKV
jgi:hypothetical protein